jgi:CBS domain-containing protein/sporulation protein YlmC with PRC-barrel domain
MLYFSELKGKTVYTEDSIEVGKLEDLIFLASENPKVTKLLIRSHKQDRLIIPIECLKKINKIIVINKDYIITELQDNELHVMRNLLDKQIIDLLGNKIVRVNDIAFLDQEGLCVAGVDIGPLGILRWFRLEGFVCRLLNLFNIKLTSNFLSWADIQPLELAHGQVKLRKREEKLEKIKPEDLADYLERTNIGNIKRIIRILDEKFAAEVIGNLNINYQSQLLKQFKPERAAILLSYIDPDEAVDILLTYSKRRRDEIVDNLMPEKKKELNYLISLSKTPMGDVLTTEYISVAPETTVKEVITEVKTKTQDFSFLYYVYVVNKDGQVVGVFNLHELLLHEADVPVYRFMVQSVLTAHLTTPIEIIFRKMLKYRLSALPVIDAGKQMLGIVTFDDIAEFVLKKFKI